MHTDLFAGGKIMWIQTQQTNRNIHFWYFFWNLAGIGMLLLNNFNELLVMRLSTTKCGNQFANSFQMATERLLPLGKINFLLKIAW